MYGIFELLCCLADEPLVQRREEEIRDVHTPARYQAVSGCKSEHPAANETRERKRREGKKTKARL